MARRGAFHPPPRLGSRRLQLPDGRPPPPTGVAKRDLLLLLLLGGLLLRHEVVTSFRLPWQCSPGRPQWGSEVSLLALARLLHGLLLGRLLRRLLLCHR